VTLDKEEKDREDDNKHVTRVFYVANHDAKAPRTALKAEDLLDNTFRMVKADENAPTMDNDVGRIAVPMKEEGLRRLSKQEKPSWAHLIVASGHQKMPLSTAIMGSKKQQGK
jgi:hypothetical protein